MTQLDIHNMKVGDLIPALEFGPVSRATLALYAGASADHNPIHIDTDFAHHAGLEDVFAHGMLSMAQFGRIITELIGAERLRNLSCRFVALTPVGARIRCQGEVLAHLQHEGQPHIRIALNACLEDGTTTLTGEALVLAK